MKKISILSPYKQTLLLFTLIFFLNKKKFFYFEKLSSHSAYAPLTTSSQSGNQVHKLKMFLRVLSVRTLITFSTSMLHITSTTESRRGVCAGSV